MATRTFFPGFRVDDTAQNAQRLVNADTLRGVGRVMKLDWYDTIIRLNDDARNQDPRRTVQRANSLD